MGTVGTVETVGANRWDSVDSGTVRGDMLTVGQCFIVTLHLTN